MILEEMLYMMNVFIKLNDQLLKNFQIVLKCTKQCVDQKCLQKFRMQFQKKLRKLQKKEKDVRIKRRRVKKRKKQKNDFLIN